MIEREIRQFESQQESEAADAEDYLAMTGQQRVDVLLDLVARYREGLGEAGRGFARIGRVIKLGED